MMIAVLSGARDRKRHARRMPRSDTRDFAQAAVRLARQARDAPARDDALGAVALGGAAAVDHFVRREDRIHRNLLFEQGLAELHLLRDSAAVDLDLHHVRLLLAQLQLLDLGVRDEANHRTILAHPLQFPLDLVVLLLRVFLRVLGHGLSLGLVPVLVEAPLHFFAQKVRPHRRQTSKPVRRLHVPDQTDADHRRRLQDRHGLHDLLLV
mmetsp:Transcript_7362/g.22676  ORF Transcript_7362/g.22676 Transcript_7362/m.22676 type:complete len:209 (-) Transcript_7362:233-859(-)